MQIREWEKVRFVAWSATIGSHQDPKKLPKNIEKFMPLNQGNTQVKKVSDEQKEAYLKVYAEYLKQVQNG